MKSYFLIGIKSDRLIELYKRNHALKYIPLHFGRFLFLMLNGLIAKKFDKQEKQELDEKINKIKLPSNPIIIIGHWRTGSTYLHQLLSKNSNFISPTYFTAAIPDSFLVSRSFHEPIMKKKIVGKRPMDNVKVGIDEPQEDEYMILRIADNSPLEKIIFHKNKKYFLNNCEEFYPSDKFEKQKWIDALSGFYKKLLFNNEDKNLVLKNPYHSMRIPFLKEIFPNARFIHIYRNPIDVVVSTENLWKIVGKDNALKPGYSSPSISEISGFLKKMLSKINSDLGALPKTDYYEIKYEDLIKNPVSHIKNIYKHFEIDYSDSYNKKLTKFVTEVKDFEKNSFIVSDDYQQLILNNLTDLIEKYK